MAAAAPPLRGALLAGRPLLAGPALAALGAVAPLGTVAALAAGAVLAVAPLAALALRRGLVADGREADLALRVDVLDHDLDGVAQVEDVLDLVDALALARAWRCGAGRRGPGGCSRTHRTW